MLSYPAQALYSALLTCKVATAHGSCLSGPRCGSRRQFTGLVSVPKQTPPCVGTGRLECGGSGGSSLPSLLGCRIVYVCTVWANVCCDNFLNGMYLLIHLYNRIF